MIVPQTTYCLAPDFFEKFRRICKDLNVWTDLHVDDMCDALCKAAFERTQDCVDRKWSKESTCTVDITFRQPLFFCGDEPIDYRADIKDTIITWGTIIRTSTSSTEVDVARDMWYMITDRAHTHQGITYKIIERPATQLNLLLAQLMMDIYTATRGSIDKSHWTRSGGPETTSDMMQSRYLNSKWMEMILNVVQDSNIFKMNSADFTTKEEYYIRLLNSEKDSTPERLHGAILITFSCEKGPVRIDKDQGE